MILNKKKTLIAAFFFIYTAASALSVEMKWQSYEKPFHFTDKKTILIQKDDNLKFKEYGFKDSEWATVSLPSNWDDLFPGWTGICWYRIHVKLPHEIPKNTLGIHLGIISDVDETYFNGHLIGKSGKFPPSRESSYDRQRLYEIPTALIKPGADNVIAVRVHGLFPGEGGAIKGSFSIALFHKLQKDLLIREFIDVFFVIIYIAIAVYFSLVFIRKSISKEYLFFTLLTLCSSIYIFLGSQIKYYIVEDFLFLKRIEYIILIFLLPLMMEYITFYFKSKHSIFHFLYFLISAASLTLVSFHNDPVYWNNVLNYLIEPTWIIPILICLYISFNELKKEEDAKYIFISFIIVLILFINDVLVERQVYDFFYLAKYGFMILIIGTAIIMRRRVIRISCDAEEYRLRKQKKPAVTDETRHKFEKALAYIKENYTADIARENFAEAIGLNHDYLGKLFIQLKGIKMADYINGLRVQQAAEMLSGTDTNVTEIAFAVGFESLSTFYRVFQKVMNETPNNYRERKRAE
ncbi:MAG: helix-turn-helix domain-containing protein [Spirochaetes bacterium]|nr:helix-turn-helix domain-containing protein [Spirochaetota bacterium]